MNKRKKALAKYAIGIFSNVAVVGIGLALYEQKWWCLVIAILAAAIGAWLTWRNPDD